MKWILTALAILLPYFSTAFELKSYQLYNDPIDVVIPCVGKDVEVLELCIEGAKQNVQNIRRVIVVSPEKYTDNAEWFDERDYPFSIRDIAHALIPDEKKAEDYLKNGGRAGWYFQQLLKLYAPLVIPGISSNVLIIDADTVFLRPTRFLNDQNGGLYATGTEYHHPYFHHMARLIPGLKKVYPQYSGICHHMLLQKAVIDELFLTIESIHQKPVWKAFCRCVDPSCLLYSGMAEYEVYFNFIFTTSDQMEIRPLKFKNISSLSQIPYWKRKGYDFISCHDYMRQ